MVILFTFLVDHSYINKLWNISFGVPIIGKKPLGIIHRISGQRGSCLEDFLVLNNKSLPEDG